MWRPSLLLLFLVACGGETITANVEIRFPDDHRNSLGDLTRLEVEIFNPNQQVCVNLTQWRSDTCNADLRTCDGIEHEAPGAPVMASVLEKTGGAWPELPLPLGEPAVRDLYVRGFTATGAEPIVYGCATFDQDDKTTVQLWRPWCDQDACDDILLPECLPSFSCENGEGRCRQDTIQVASWREDVLGTCDVQPTQTATGACRQAVITCRPDGFDFEAGICPRPEPMCSDDRNADDLDCDGAPPMPCVTECSDGEERSYREALRDTQRVVCVNQDCVGGTFQDQMRVQLGVEVCDTWDNDCDGLRDRSMEANASCEAERLANLCDDGVCFCGRSPQCEVGQRCERSECITPDAGVRDSGVVDRRDAGFRDARPRDSGPRDGGTDRPRDGGRRRDAR